MPEARRHLLQPSGALLVAGICACVLVLSRWLPAGGVPTLLPGFDTCAFHALTGLPCPGCGLTRAFTAISHGRFHEAWTLHPFAYPLYGACLGGVASPWLLRRFPWLSGPAMERALRGAAVIVVAGLMVFGTWRLIHAIHAPSSRWSQT